MPKDIHLAHTPNMRRIRSGKHPFSGHPILSGENGARLTRRGGEDYIRRVLQHSKGLKKLGFDTGISRSSDLTEAHPMQLMQILGQSAHTLMNMERGHRPELQELAIKTVARAHGLDESQVREMIEDVGISEGMGALGTVGSNERSSKTPDEEFLRKYKDEIEKRQTHNALIHGASINHMNEAVSYAKEDLERMNPRLYHQAGFFTNLASLFHVLMEVPEPLPPMPRAGTNELKWDLGGEVKVRARAESFPILVQELSKGITEATFAHGLPQKGDMSKEDAKTLIDHTDKETHEHWHFMMGPELARRVHGNLAKHKAVLGEGSRGEKEAYTRMLLSRVSAKDLHKNLDGLISDDPARQKAAAEELRERMLEVEEEYKR